MGDNTWDVSPQAPSGSWLTITANDILFWTVGSFSFVPMGAHIFVLDHMNIHFEPTTYRYISAFGVYQDFYTREFLQNETPSNIRSILRVLGLLSPTKFILVG